MFIFTMYKQVKQHIDTVAPPAPSSNDAKTELSNRLKALINSAPCILFMKVRERSDYSYLNTVSNVCYFQGSALEPRCGFSRQTVSLLNEHNCKYSTFDILQDQTVRQGLKEYSNWPTYPQLYVNGMLFKLGKGRFS